MTTMTGAIPPEKGCIYGGIYTNINPDKMTETGKLF